MKDHEQIYFWAHMLDEAMNKSMFICEDRESKNMHKARRWIEQNHPEVIGQKLQNGVTITPQKLIEEIRNTIPSSRLADCKFLVGVTRLYFDNQQNNEIQKMFSQLNKILKILATVHADEYDENLNDLSFEELEKKFSGSVQNELDQDREEIGKLQLIKKQDYEIIPIDSFEEAEKYGEYTSWCVTHYENMYESYTNNGLGRFYFCLAPGFEKVPPTPDKDCPMDTYGKSMIAISVNDDGSLNTCTCRWNHDNGGNDNMMNTREISQFFGLNFYETFVPHSGEEIFEKCKNHKLKDDEISRALNAIKVKDDNDVIYYINLINGKIVKSKYVSQNCVIKDCKFYHVLNGQIYKGSPQKVSDYFDCSKNKLTSLEGVPQEINGSFDCNDNKLTSLEGAPRKVKGFFDCDFNQLTSLEGAPQEVIGDFYCHKNQLITLKGVPYKVDGNFYCANNQLTSLREAPQEVMGYFDCSNNKLTSIEGGPQELGAGFYCSHNQLLSLNGAPQKVMKDFYCHHNQLTSLEGAPQEVYGGFHCEYNQLTSLEGAPQKVMKDFYCDNNQLTSLEGAPQKVGGLFDCSNNQLTKEQIAAYEKFLRNPTPEHIDETGHYKP